jgi:triphosphoribosyl-dephospho-CoA synthetase
MREEDLDSLVRDSQVNGFPIIPASILRGYVKEATSKGKNVMDWITKRVNELFDDIINDCKSIYREVKDIEGYVWRAMGDMAANQNLELTTEKYRNVVVEEVNKYIQEGLDDYK